jgi:hypothetical protein
MKNKHTCPVCKFDGLKEAPFGPHNEPSYEICPKCGFEFGFDGGNDPVVFENFYQRWLENGEKKII